MTIALIDIKMHIIITPKLLYFKENRIALPI